MPRRAFDTFTVPESFWQDRAVLQAVAGRDIGQLFRLVQKATGASQTQVGIATGLTQAQVSETISGTRHVTSVEVLRRIVDGLSMPYAVAAVLFLGRPPRPTSAGVAVAAERVVGDPTPADGRDLLSHIEVLRQAIHDSISGGSVTAASVDDWELTVARHGQATRYRPAVSQLVELMADFTELQRLLARQHVSSASRRLTRATAQMAGLMFLTLIELDMPLAARNWARTARVAADEAGDPAIRSWVMAQEAYVHYYAGNVLQAVDVAQYAQTLAGRTACVGVPLAAALEGRALAVLGREHEARDAIRRAEVAVGSLDAESLAPSAFGYNEAQLRFHEGNALTHVHDISGAMTAQDRALELYPVSDYLDRTLVQLDQATCLAHDGDASSAMTHAVQALADLPAEQRIGIIVLRGRQVLGSLPRQQRALPAARDFRELLTRSADHEGDEP
jgi:hypothetical protein